MGSERVMEFLEFATADRALPLRTEEGIGIRIVEAGQGLAVAVIVDDTTTSTAYREAWKEIQPWREALQAFQGRRLNTREEICAQLASLKDLYSWAELAQKVNSRIEELLRQALDASKGFAEKPGRDSEEYFNWIRWNVQLRVSMAEADTWYKFCRPTEDDEERRQDLVDAMKRIKAGDPAFPPHMEPTPANGMDVRERVRHFLE